MVEKKMAEVEKKTTAEEKTTTKGKVAAKKDVTTDKAAEKKTTKKAATKKAAEKKTTTKKAAAKKPKKVPKAVFVEYCGAQTKIDVESYEEKVKEIWLNDWKRLARDLKQIDIYIKPEDGKVYFVVNGTEHGAIDL